MNQVTILDVIYNLAMLLKQPQKDTCHDLGHFSFDFFKTFFSAQCKQILEEKNIQTGNLTIFFCIFSNVVNFFLAFVLKCLKLVQFLYHELINVFTNL